VTTVFIFFDSATRESSFAGACTPVKNVIYCIVQGTNLSKKVILGNFEFRSRLGDMASET